MSSSASPRLGSSTAPAPLPPQLAASLPPPSPLSRQPTSSKPRLMLLASSPAGSQPCPAAVAPACAAPGLLGEAPAAAAPEGRGRCSTVILKMAWLRLLRAFLPLSAVRRMAAPHLSSSITSDGRVTTCWEAMSKLMVSDLPPRGSSAGAWPWRPLGAAGVEVEVAGAEGRREERREEVPTRVPALVAAAGDAAAALLPAAAAGLLAYCSRSKIFSCKEAGLSWISGDRWSPSH